MMHLPHAYSSASQQQVFSDTLWHLNEHSTRRIGGQEQSHGGPGWLCGALGFALAPGGGGQTRGCRSRDRVSCLGCKEHPAPGT